MNAGLGWSEYRDWASSPTYSETAAWFVREQPVHYTSNDEENLAFVEAAAAVEFGISPRAGGCAEDMVAHGTLPAPYHCTHGRGEPVYAWFPRARGGSKTCGPTRSAFRPPSTRPAMPSSPVPASSVGDRRLHLAWER